MASTIHVWSKHDADIFSFIDSVNILNCTDFFLKYFLSLLVSYEFEYQEILSDFLSFEELNSKTYFSYLYLNYWFIRNLILANSFLSRARLTSTSKSIY